MRLQKTFEQLVTAVEEAADEAMMELELHVKPAESPKKMNKRQAADVARAKKYLMGRYSSYGMRQRWKLTSKLKSLLP